MTQSIDEIRDDLQHFISGRTNVDFSPWLGMRLVKKDITALAVFLAQRDQENPGLQASLDFRFSDDGELFEISEGETSSEPSFEREVNRFKQEVEQWLQFPFEEYFLNDIRQAKLDLIIAFWIGYRKEQFTKVLMPYRLQLKDVPSYIEKYYKTRGKQIPLPPALPDDPLLHDFQRELGKLPLGTRLHLFDILEHSSFSKKSVSKPLSEKTLSGTNASLDAEESARILRKSPLISSLPNGSGIVSPKYTSPATFALDYAKKVSLVFYMWTGEVEELIENQLGVYTYDDLDPSNDGYSGPIDLDE